MNTEAWCCTERRRRENSAARGRPASAARVDDGRCTFKAKTECTPPTADGAFTAVDRRQHLGARPPVQRGTVATAVPAKCCCHMPDSESLFVAFDRQCSSVCCRFSSPASELSPSRHELLVVGVAARYSLPVMFGFQSGQPSRWSSFAYGRCNDSGKNACCSSQHQRTVRGQQPASDLSARYSTSLVHDAYSTKELLIWLALVGD